MASHHPPITHHSLPTNSFMPPHPPLTHLIIYFFIGNTTIHSPLTTHYHFHFILKTNIILKLKHYIILKNLKHYIILKNLKYLKHHIIILKNLKHYTIIILKILKSLQTRRLSPFRANLLFLLDDKFLESRVEDMLVRIHNELHVMPHVLILKKLKIFFIFLPLNLQLRP